VSALIYQTSSEEGTIELGRSLAPMLPRIVTVLLVGNLGAGKTTLTKGLVEGLGVARIEDVSSPTFTLIHEYGRKVYHVDLYRLETEREVLSLGLDEIMDDGLVLIEWGERFPHLWARERIEIRIQADGNSRTFEISGLS
jgi:tRNA threonylcarbamoyladenosine biosynthesis protein TsaE